MVIVSIHFVHFINIVRNLFEVVETFNENYREQHVEGFDVAKIN